jgi:hypothetical protein
VRGSSSGGCSRHRLRCHWWMGVGFDDYCVCRVFWGGVLVRIFVRARGFCGEV